MNKPISIFVCLILVFLVGCTSGEGKKTDEMPTVIYFGQGEEWFATYTISSVRESYFASLYIQYITDRTKTTVKQTADIGKIEYILKGKEWTLSSSEPQSLVGILNFHTATEINADQFDLDLADTVTLEVRWKDQVEKIDLKR
ncbi:hypothetical protein [Brevibacillus daliensis]|uniref:hypothetical protein n=1 Tax=Brevibacillus daliensis TaxID=2892995 RepID=UPI001E30C39F|nr:hypothetical protein [Brevibacillus daliensis]